jgi:acetyl esterase/lipase
MGSKASRCGGWLVALLLSGLPAESVAAEGPAAQAAMQRLLDLPYGIPYGGAGRTAVAGTSAGQRSLDLYLPARDEKGPKPPLFVYIHGGAWISGDKRQYAPLGLSLSAQGVAVAIINYRLSDSGEGGVRHPAHAQDAAQAVAFLRKQAAQYGYDAGRIFVGGHSAGAHMSALLAYDGSFLFAVGEKPESLRGFVGLEGIYDLNELVRRFPSYRVDFLQAAFGSDETTWQKASPQHLVAAASGVHKRPWLLIHSRTDELVDLEQSRHFQKALEKQSIPVRFVSPERGTHFSIISEVVTPQSTLCQQLLAFLKG